MARSDQQADGSRGPSSGGKSGAAADGKSAPTDRDARLKAALKANLARRKAQARARQDKAAFGSDPQQSREG